MYCYIYMETVQVDLKAACSYILYLIKLEWLALILVGVAIVSNLSI